MDTIRLLHHTIWASPLMLLLYGASIAYIVQRIRRGGEPRVMLFLVTYSVLALIGVAYNPLLPRFFNRFADDEYSWLRFAWIVPIYLMMAYAAARVVLTYQGTRRRLIAAALVLALIVAAGEPRPGIYLRAENAYKLDTEIVELCDAILADRGIDSPTDRSRTFRVLVQTEDNNIYSDGSRDNSLYFGIRQYASCMELAMGRVDDVVREADYLSYENSGIRNGYAYFVADNTEAIKNAAAEVGYQPLFETEHYLVMKSDFTATLWIVRHARTEANEGGVLSGMGSDYPLTAEGIAAAIATGEALKGLEIDSVHTSELARTMKTASLVLAGMGESEYTAGEAAALGNDIPIDTAASPGYNLNDVLWGDADGLTYDEMISAYGITDARDIFGAVEDESYVSPIPGAENAARLYDRLNTAMCDYVTAEAAAGRDGANVLVVGHSSAGDWISRVIPEAAGIDLPNASVTVVRFSGGEWELLAPPMTEPEEIAAAVEAFK